MAKKPFKDPRGPHVRLYVGDLLDSPAWSVLSLSARVLYIEFRASMGKTNNGDLSCTLSNTAAKRGAFKSPTTLAAALFELRALGFVAVTRSGAVVAGSKLPTLYRFTDEPYAQFTKEGGYTFGPGKPTFDFAQHKTISDARTAVEIGKTRLHAEAVKRNASSRKKNSTLQKVECHAPDSVQKGPPIAPDSVQEAPPVAPESGVLLQLGSGVSAAPAAKPSGKRGQQRRAEVEIDGLYFPRALCTVDLCPTLNCGARLGELHNKGCELEPCPSCGSPSWRACKCGHKGKAFRSLGSVARRWPRKDATRAAAELG